jgi:D-glycero-D-manno-heptose 1,7-bisphosphate phosphatase
VDEARRPAVFLDRDGTINEQMGYLNHISRLRLLPGAAAAIARLNRAGLAVVAISNQSGVARGYFPEELVGQVHQRMKALLAEAGARLDGVYYCPHHPQAALPAYRVDCLCRKPRPGLVQRAAAELHLDPARSFVVGDQVSDLMLGRAVGAASVLVRTGYGLGEEAYLLAGSGVSPDFTAEDLAGAVDWILERTKPEGAPS